MVGKKVGGNSGCSTNYIQLGGLLIDVARVITRDTIDRGVIPRNSAGHYQGDQSLNFHEVRDSCACTSSPASRVYGPFRGRLCLSDSS